MQSPVLLKTCLLLLVFRSTTDHRPLNVGVHTIVVFDLGMATLCLSMERAAFECVVGTTCSRSNGRVEVACRKLGKSMIHSVRGRVSQTPQSRPQSFLWRQCRTPFVEFRVICDRIAGA